MPLDARRAVRLLGWTAAATAAVLIAACGSTTTDTVSAQTATTTATATPSATPTPSTATVTNDDLRALSGKLYPGGGATCFHGDATFASCPLTARLRAALESALAAQGTGGGADPVCGCQNLDPNIAFTYEVLPPSGGLIHASMFGGSYCVDYVVIADGASPLVDDILYCSAQQPHSVYPNEQTQCP